MPTKLNYRVGLVQMCCGPDPDANLDKAADRVREAARGGAQVICLPELFRAQYFCQREDIALFDLAEPIPGPSTERLSAVAREENVVVVASLFERRAAGLYHNTAACCIKTARWPGCTARCISRTIRSITRSSTSRRAIWASRHSIPRWEDRHAGVLGPVVSGGRADHGAAGSECAVLSHGDWLASGGEGRVRRGAV